MVVYKNQYDFGNKTIIWLMSTLILILILTVISMLAFNQLWFNYMFCVNSFGFNLSFNCIGRFSLHLIRF